MSHSACGMNAEWKSKLMDVVLVTASTHGVLILLRASPTGDMMASYLGARALRIYIREISSY